MRDSKAGNETAVKGDKGVGKQHRGRRDDLPPYREVEACRQAGIYSSNVPSDVKEWRLWRIRRERMKVIYRYEENDQYAYSDPAESDDEKKDLAYLKSPIDRVGSNTSLKPHPNDRQAERQRSSTARRKKAADVGKATPLHANRPAKAGLDSLDDLADQFAKEFGLCLSGEMTARQLIKVDQAMMVMAGFRADVRDALTEAGLDDPSLSSEERSRGCSRMLKECYEAVEGLGHAESVSTCNGQIISVPYHTSGHARPETTATSDDGQPRLVVTVSPPFTPLSSQTSTSNLSDAASTAPTSAASLAPDLEGDWPSPRRDEDPSTSGGPSSFRPSKLSAADQHHCDLVAAIQCQALLLGTPLEERLHNVILAIYTKVFTRGPCPPPISGISYPPVNCNDKPDKHMRAAKAFVHRIWSMSDPYALSTGQWGLKANEVFVLRMIIFVRCVAGWYKMDVQQGLVDEDYDGKGKEKSIWW